MDNGIEELDEGLKGALRRQARQVYLQSIAAGLVLTLLVLLLPG